MQELVNAVRGTGATNIIVLNGIRYGTQLDQWLQYKPVDPANQLVAGFHSYGDGLDCQNAACCNSVLAGVTAQAPLITTEIGEFDCNHTYIDQLLSWLDTKAQHSSRTGLARRRRPSAQGTRAICSRSPGGRCQPARRM